MYLIGKIYMKIERSFKKIIGKILISHMKMGIERGFQKHLL